MRRLLLLTIFAGLALAGSAHAVMIHSGTITPGQGLNGGTLGMTRGQVIDQLGKPTDETGYRAMDYTDIINNGSGDIIEFFRGRKRNRVNLIQLDLHGKRFKLDDGNAVFAKGGLLRLFHRYHKRLHKNDIYQGQKSYSLYGHFHGRKVGTTFLVTKFAAAKGRVYEIDIFYPH